MKTVGELNEKLNEGITENIKTTGKQLEKDFGEKYKRAVEDSNQIHEWVRINTSEINTTKIESGSKIYCEGQVHAFKLKENLDSVGCETTIGCNEAGMWSVYINKTPSNSL